jgi:hypothetical protein
MRLDPDLININHRQGQCHLQTIKHILAPMIQTITAIEIK